MQSLACTYTDRLACTGWRKEGKEKKTVIPWCVVTCTDFNMFVPRSLALESGAAATRITGRSLLIMDRTRGSFCYCLRCIITSSVIHHFHYCPPVSNMAHRAGTSILHLSLFPAICSSVFMSLIYCSSFRLECSFEGCFWSSSSSLPSWSLKQHCLW